jgi:hypothetical protein
LGIGGVAKVEEHLLYKYEALSLNPGNTKKKKGKTKIDFDLK